MRLLLRLSCSTFLLSSRSQPCFFAQLRVQNNQHPVMVLQLQSSQFHSSSLRPEGFFQSIISPLKSLFGYPNNQTQSTQQQPSQQQPSQQQTATQDQATPSSQESSTASPEKGQFEKQRDVAKDWQFIRQKVISGDPLNYTLLLDSLTLSNPDPRALEKLKEIFVLLPFELQEDLHKLKRGSYQHKKKLSQQTGVSLEELNHIIEIYIYFRATIEVLRKKFPQPPPSSPSSHVHVKVSDPEPHGSRRVRVVPTLPEDPREGLGLLGQYSRDIANQVKILERGSRGY